MIINVAIDGPSGAGKSTIAKQIAKNLGYTYIDTGAMFRVIGLYMYRSGVDPKDAENVNKILPEVGISLKHIDGEQHVFLNGEDVSKEIREHIISRYASDVSAIPEVRKYLLQMQRDIAIKNSVIMDGRDIGSVVLPNAQVKIYLTASPEDRATRRYEELVSKGQDVTYEQILQDVNQRDYNDMHRKEAPLKKAEGAILVDTTGNKLEDSIKIIETIIKERINL